MKLDDSFYNYEWSTDMLTEAFKSTKDFRNLPFKILDALIGYHSHVWFCIKCNAFHPYDFMKSETVTTSMFLKDYINQLSEDVGNKTYLNCNKWRGAVLQKIYGEIYTTLKLKNPLDRETAKSLIEENFHTEKTIEAPERLLFSTPSVEFQIRENNIKIISTKENKVYVDDDIFRFAEKYSFRNCPNDKNFPTVINSKGILVVARDKMDYLYEPLRQLHVTR
jgi:hypothetical protein